MSAGTPKPLPSRIGLRNYANQVTAVAECLAPFGLSVPEGTPTNARRPVLLCSELRDEPMLVVKVELDGEADPEGHASLPPALVLLCDALSQSGGLSGFGLGVLCVPRDGEKSAPAADRAALIADLEMKLALCVHDLQPEESQRRRLRIRLVPRPRRRRLAEWLERHPFLYSLATFGEFSFKHPLFGQVLCGGPCGISGAWQFTCTMSKTFVSRRQIERNFFDRPVFGPIRNHPNSMLRRAWSAWEWTLRQMLGGPIVLRRAIVYVARHLPPVWFAESAGLLRAATVTLFNHLECPKSVRNGACGAPTVDGLCGELMKSGIRKQCIFYYRNTRDIRGAQFAAQLLERGQRIRTWRWGRPVAWLMAITAAVTDRRALSMQIYPRVDTGVAGASAIVSAMGGRFKGVTLFGTYAHLPRSVARSEIGIIARSRRGARVLARARRTVGPLPRRVSEGAAALALILNALGREGRARPPGRDVPPAKTSTYEKILAHQMNSEPGAEPGFARSEFDVRKEERRDVRR